MLTSAAPAFAGLPNGWQRGRDVDAVTDAAYEGLIYKSGADELLFACRTKGGAKGFFIRVASNHHLGWRKGSTARMTYRLGDQPAVEEWWLYDSRGAVPRWGDKTLAMKFVSSGATSFIFRMRGKDGDTYDLTAPAGDDLLKALGEVAGSCE